MDKESNQELEQINESLKDIALNQAAVWAEIERIEGSVGLKCDPKIAFNHK